MKRILIPILATLLLLSYALAWAQSGGSRYSIDTYSIDGGGTAGGTAGGYSLSGTAGQPDAGLLQTGRYTLGNGFWAGGSGPPLPESYRVYLPVLLKASP